MIQQIQIPTRKQQIPTVVIYNCRKGNPDISYLIKLAVAE